MSGPHFLALAWRVSAYQGVMAAKMAAAEGDGTVRRSEPGGAVESTPQAIRHDPALADVIDYG